MTEYECECGAILTPRSDREVVLRFATLLVPLTITIGLIGLTGIKVLGTDFGYGLLVGLAATALLRDTGGWLYGIASRDKVVHDR